MGNSPWREIPNPFCFGMFLHTIFETTVIVPQFDSNAVSVSQGLTQLPNMIRSAASNARKIQAQSMPPAAAHGSHALEAPAAAL